MSDTDCGYALVDPDGREEPCGKKTTGWRWYQDVSHEDCLEPACDWHANEGGRRMAEMTDKLNAILDRPAAAPAEPEYQWSTRDGYGMGWLATTEGQARERLAADLGQISLHRRPVEYGPWESVEPAAAPAEPREDTVYDSLADTPIEDYSTWRKVKPTIVEPREDTVPCGRDDGCSLRGGTAHCGGCRE